MLAGLKRRLTRRHIDIKECDDDDKDDVHTFPPPANYIKISQGKIQLVHQTRSLESDTINEAHAKQDKEILENRIVELEGALLRLQEQFQKKNQCGSPTFEKELREQLENMNRVIRTKERKQMQTCREHKALQTRFARQESLLHTMQQENRALLMRIRQYEHCLDDVMRKVVDAIVAEDNLREEVAMLKGRVRDLEAQNAALSASPAKGRDEGYCTMSSGQPQPSNGHLEDLPEEPEQWLLPAEPCSTEMEDWSMSQEELAVITLDDERDHLQHVQAEHEKCNRLRANSGATPAGCAEHNDWLWRTNELINSTMAETDSITESITQLLQQKVVYSEDEEIACTDFTNDFYKLVNIRSNSAHSLYSYIEGDTDDEDDDDDDDDGNGHAHNAADSPLSAVHLRGTRCSSPTPSEAGRAQLTSCSSSETDDLSTHCTTTATKTLLNTEHDYEIIDDLQVTTPTTTSELHDSDIDIADMDSQRNETDPPESLQKNLNDLNERQFIADIIKNELRRPPHILVKSQSMLEEEEPGCILRNNQRREMVLNAVVRSGSINCDIGVRGSNATNANTPTNSSSSQTNSTSSNASTPTKTAYKLQQQQRTLNSWRRSNGWKRVTSPAHSPTTNGCLNNLVSTKKETKSEIPKSFPQKLIPTKIPTCLPQAIQSANQQQHQQSNNNTSKHQLQQQQQQPQTPQLARKSKIPPPVPIRRSYVS